MSVPLLATWPAMEEREKGGINEELVELCGVGILGENGILENGKACGCEGRKRIKEKGKRKRN